jgi:cytochrome oxidase Cu insertion factor (SCO1/SenC/PrrC family)
MKATCPNNPEHKKFVTVAHISQDWVVDENGNFIEVYNECNETVAPPNPDNIWECNECGASAIVK